MHSLLHCDMFLCHRCQEQFFTLFEKTQVDGITIRAIYDYNEFMQSNLYILKGCGDIELAPCFLNYHLPWIKLHYRNYYVVPVPSHASRDNERGFNQVEEIFRCSEIPIIKALFKTSDRKQSDLSQEERKNVGETIRWNDEVDITGKKILLVDDVMTTGYTIRACIKIIKAHLPKSLEVLVVSRVASKG